MAEQIALPLQRPDGGPARIVVGSGNRAALEALSDPAPWPFRTAILAGPPRAGRSLLARWFVAAGLGEAVDDAHRADETALFHRWNRAQADGRALLLTVADGGWRIGLPDLASRMGAALVLTLGPPDEEEATALMHAHAEARGLALGDGAAAYLLPRMERSHAAIERMVAEIDRLSLERRVAPTLSVWRAALDAVAGPEQARLL